MKKNIIFFIIYFLCFSNINAKKIFIAEYNIYWDTNTKQSITKINTDESIKYEKSGSIKLYSTGHKRDKEYIRTMRKIEKLRRANEAYEKIEYSSSTIIDEKNDESGFTNLVNLILMTCVGGVLLLAKKLTSKNKNDA